MPWLSLKEDLSPKCSDGLPILHTCTLCTRLPVSHWFRVPGSCVCRESRNLFQKYCRRILAWLHAHVSHSVWGPHRSYMVIVTDGCRKLGYMKPWFCVVCIAQVTAWHWILRVLNRGLHRGVHGLGPTSHRSYASLVLHVQLRSKWFCCVLRVISLSNFQNCIMFVLVFTTKWSMLNMASKPEEH